MTPAYLHQQLMQACENGNTEDVKQCLDSGADPNFNIKRAANALYLAIQRDNHQMIDLLLEYGTIVNAFVLQKAIEKDKNYLPLLIPNFTECKDKNLLIGALQAAINSGDLDLAKQAINQGASPGSLLIYAVLDLDSVEILELLLENGFDIHADKNMILTEWMGSSDICGWENWKPAKDDLLNFIFDYYLEKQESMAKFNSLRLPDKRRLFTLGLGRNNFNMMKFALSIGANKSEALNSALRQYNAYKQGNVSSMHATLFKDNQSGEVNYEIIEYLLNSNIEFNKTTISNAVLFKYRDVLDALSRMDDLVYGYEMAYTYENDDLCQYFIRRGVSNAAQSLAKMKVSAIKGDIKALRKAVNDGANVQEICADVIVEVINANQAEILKYLYESGILLDTSLNQHLNHAMNFHKAYESISYLIELGFDITKVKNIPIEYKIKYPVIADMWEKRFRDIFEYTLYLATEVHPKVEGKKKEEILKRIAALSTLPYVVKKSKVKI